MKYEWDDLTSGLGRHDPTISFFLKIGYDNLDGSTPSLVQNHNIHSEIVEYSTLKSKVRSGVLLHVIKIT